MLDLKLLREEPEMVREALRRRGLTTVLDDVLRQEGARRQLLTELERKRHEHKQASEAFGRAKGQGGLTRDALKALADEVKRHEQALQALETTLTDAVALLPNIPHESVPVGDVTANRVARVVGEKRSFTFRPLAHVELAERSGLIDFARGAKVSGSHFHVFTGRGAKLERALINWMLDVHTAERGYTEVFPPFVVNRPSMFGTGQLPKFEEDMYRLKDDDLFLVPTAEVPLTNLHRDEILHEAQLPVRYAGYTACFRREAGSYGKETRGLVRVHQFDKVELVKLTTPETSYDELERLVEDAELILKRLGLHYRVVCLATQDLGFAAAKCYDLEVWAPGLGQYLEVSSCSNFAAFQARRANIRYRPSGSSAKPAYVHTLNGSGVALARTLACLLETYQQPDGHIMIPEALQPYFHGDRLL